MARSCRTLGELLVYRFNFAVWTKTANPTSMAPQGIFPHGIESLSVTDFFTVSVRHRAYLQGAVGIAG